MVKRKKQIALFIVVALIMTIASTLFIQASSYTEIRTAADLDNVRNNLSGKYRLVADIDLTNYVSKTNTKDKGWYPIGYGAPYFTGELDGNGHTISGLWSGAKWGIAYKGLFATTKGATIKNLNIDLDSRGITGSYAIGAVTGTALNGTLIDNVNVSGGQVIVTAGGYAGGIVGHAYSGSPQNIISNSTVENLYSRTSGNYAGGIIGVADKTTLIDSCEAKNVNIDAYSYAGGIAGAIKGQSTIVNSIASGNVTTRASYAGGLVGAEYETSHISKSMSTAKVSATTYAGGLVGTMYEASTISESCAYGDVSTKTYIAGGLVGEAVASYIDNTYARGNVTGGTGVGGLIGYFSGSGASNNKSITNSYSSGRVTGKGTTEYGAFNGRSGVVYKGTNYYDADTASVRQAYGSAGTPKGMASAYPQGRTTPVMMQEVTFEGWDFDNIWYIDENNDYPILRMEGRTPVKTAPTLVISTEVKDANLVINGNVTDASAITEVYYIIKNANNPAGEKVVLLNASPDQGIKTYDIENVLASLVEGENTLTVVAVNKHGLTAEEVVTVNYVAPVVKPPVIVINSNGGTTNESDFDLSGYVRDEAVNLSEVYYIIKNADNPAGEKVVIFSAGASGQEIKDYDFLENLTLVEGENTITVVATNAKGISAEETVRLNYEVLVINPPTIVITSNGGVVEVAEFDLSGFVRDDVTNLSEVYYIIKNADNPAGEKVVIFSATGGQEIKDYDFLENLTLVEGENTITVVATNAKGVKAEESITVTFEKPDMTVPAIEIKYDGYEITKDESIFVEGRAFGDTVAIGEVYYVITNEDNPTGKKVSIFTASGDGAVAYDIAETIELGYDENIITFVVVSKNGVKTESSLTVYKV